MTALTALDAPHEVMDEALAERSEAIFNDFLTKLASVPRADLDATAEQLMETVRVRLESEDDAVTRGITAQTLINIIDARTERERDIRDVNLGFLVWPWHEIEETYKRQIQALLERKTTEGLTEDEYRRARNAINETRRKAQRNSPFPDGVPWQPVELSGHGHISRGLINSRVIPRIPYPVPDIPVEQAVRESERAGRIVAYISESVAKSTKNRQTLRDIVEAVRNEAVQIMLGPESEEFPRWDGRYAPQRGLGISNADVARELGMKTSRIAQLRTGNG